ncbi:hypothetical protein CKAN_00961100 [Cinnamomum micranthum f. kanehirae]|uniref:Uncharacterized protein n=1 Tax=Cinnamomum micranthum f. kanehirae TaxID=337451 RepID=A0A443NR04_9MAGN|nr:hypothetical protein CKAN_00961100 [Cinnamomum micranthum f. kanehirae]
MVGPERGARRRERWSLVMGRPSWFGRSSTKKGKVQKSSSVGALSSNQSPNSKPRTSCRLIQRLPCPNPTKPTSFLAENPTPSSEITSKIHFFSSHTCQDGPMLVNPSIGGVGLAGSPANTRRMHA